MRNKLIPLLIALFLSLLAACLPGGASNPTALKVLPALQSAHLSGSLIFIEFGQHGNRLEKLDLATGKLQPLFSAPDRSWLAYAALSPDGQTLLIAYAPPPPKGQVQLSNTDLYTLPVTTASAPAGGSSAPRLLLEHKVVNESYFTPTWSPDGRYIYYTHNIIDASARTGVVSVIERAPISNPGGQAAPGAAQVVARNAIWPVPSPDGQRLAYLTLSEFTSVDRLTLASADGANPVEGLPAAQVNTVDAHFYAPDGKSIYYSTINETPSAPTATPNTPQGRGPLPSFELALGARPVQAHNLPSDWFRVTLDGQKIQQVTGLHNTQLAGTFSPDGQWIAFLSQQGLYVMKPDGSGLAQIASGTAMGSIIWVK